MFDSIALIQCSDMHTEVLGGLISLFGNNCHCLYIYYVPYPADFVRYYVNQHITTTPIRVKKIDKKFNDRDHDHDLYVFVTGREYTGQTDPDRTLLLSHHTDERTTLKRLKTLGVFSISPVYNKIPYFLSVYKPVEITRQLNDKFTLLFSGYTNPENKDLKALVHLLDHIKQHDLPIRVNVVNYYPIKELDEYKSICKVYVDLPAKKMMKMVSEADYVLTLAKKNSSYHRNQLSGIIPLAISLGTPLIIDTNLADIYGFSNSNSLIYEPKEFKQTILNEFEKFRKKDKSKAVIQYRDKMVKIYQKKMKNFLKTLIKNVRIP